MALLFCDSFDYYSAAQLGRKWTIVDGGTDIGTTFGRNGSKGLQVQGNFGVVSAPLPSNLATIIVGGAFKFTNAVTAGVFLSFSDAATRQCGLQYNVDGSLSVIGAAGTALATSSAGTLPSPLAQHNYIEMKVTISDAAGAVDVRVNGIAVAALSLTSVDTKATSNAYATNVRLNAAGLSSNHVMVDDFYICDTSGSTNNTFLGDVRIEALFPSGAGATTNFSPSAGSNYQCVDENPANDDTDYVSSTNVGDKDTYALADLASTLGSVMAVVVNTVDRKDDAGSRTHAHVVRLSGTESTGTAYAPTTSYVNHQTVFETKPGGGAWAIADVNSAEAGHTVAA